MNLQSHDWAKLANTLKSFREVDVAELEETPELKACGANQPGGGGFRSGNTCGRGGGSGGSADGPAPTKNKLHGNLEDTISSARTIVDKKVQAGTISKSEGQRLRSDAQRKMGVALDGLHAEVAPNTKMPFSGQITPTKTNLHEKLETTINGARSAIDQSFQAGLITATKASQMKSQMQKKLNQRLNEIRSQVVAGLG